MPRENDQSRRSDALLADPDRQGRGRKRQSEVVHDYLKIHSGDPVSPGGTGMSISGYSVIERCAERADGGGARAWDRFWFSPTDPTTLCFMRICAGCVLLYVYVGYSFDLMSYVHPERSWMDEKAYRFLYGTTCRSSRHLSNWTEDRAELTGARRLYSECRSTSRITSTLQGSGSPARIAPRQGICQGPIYLVHLFPPAR